MGESSQRQCDTSPLGGEVKPTTQNQDSTIFITPPVAFSSFKASMQGTWMEMSSMIDPMWSMLQAGWIILPLSKKAPIVKWKAMIAAGPLSLGHRTQIILNHRNHDEWGVLTGPASGVMVLDLDIPLNEDILHDLHGYSYTKTPSGGRHYYFAYREGMHHGLGVIPRVDIPYIARIYGLPTVIFDEMPVNGRQPEPYHGDSEFVDPDPPHMDDLNHCTFIRWFQNRRTMPWEGRYPVARAYASNAARVQCGDLSLGPNYRHTEQIYKNLGMPQTCMHFSRYYQCPDMDPLTGRCKISGAYTPYGLARRYHEDRQSR